MRIINTAVVKTYDNPAKTDVKIDSHWNDRSKVCITIGEETREFYGHDLIMAINNCMNV